VLGGDCRRLSLLGFWVLEVMAIAWCSPSPRKNPPKPKEEDGGEEDEEDENVQQLEQCARAYKCLEVRLPVTSSQFGFSLSLHLTLVCSYALEAKFSGSLTFRVSSCNVGSKVVASLRLMSAQFWPITNWFAFAEVHRCWRLSYSPEYMSGLKSCHPSVVHSVCPAYGSIVSRCT
jgi:hypothetical protein